MASGISIKIDDELLRNIHVRAAPKGISICQQDGRGSPSPSLFSIALDKSA